MKKCKFKITGLDCAACASHLEDKLQKIDGVEDVSISFMTENFSFSCQEDRKEEILKIIKKVIHKEEPDVEIEEV